ncbi:hypothetical protein [Pleionea sediminis]|uniref:hypothetical protein n=1 Tax=Pleionea sediminis TaxID=2569479 RepID=UPI0011847A18|nr:hypothetical protein [Pleionea sediminis]
MNIENEIIPGKSLGGIELGRNVADYSQLLESKELSEKLRYKQTSIYSTRYWVEGIPIEINVDTRTGVIYKISAINGYKGALNSSIKIGTPVTELMKAKPDFYYDECDEAFYSKEVDGIAIEVDEDDPLPEELIELKVEVITVFLPETFKP